ncbi:respiration control sensor protein ArcB [Seminavis robusta]|uniref:histidine kinase n=1 Tax=Seminavis robusta TaxID=568900 RepID=A0A9N8DGU2_9STRA|nr:respiration control sensor protein ArcB [Seminavis robusta]|eukprot:Sro135_g063870.1 respiration control sensor protein ArcB (1058) ;mRNA; f:83864-87291
MDQQQPPRQNAFCLDVEDQRDGMKDDSTKKHKQKQYDAPRRNWVVVAVALILWTGCTLALSYLAYQMAREQENQEFEAKFTDFANEIIRSSVNNARNSHLVLESFGRTVTSLALYSNATWPLLTLPHYETRSNDYITITKAESITFCPVVSAAMRTKYENYTVENQGWIQQGIDYEYYRNIFVNDREEEDSPSDNNQEVDLVINREGFSVLNRAKPIQPFIWTHAPLTHRAVPEESLGPYVPIWQTFPAPRNSFVVGNNLMSVPDFYSLLRDSFTRKATTLSDIFDNNFRLFGNAQTIDVDPKSVLVQPIFENILLHQQQQQHADGQIVGYMIVIKKWHQIFQDVLYRGAKPVDVVLRNTCDKAFTYRIIGSEGYFLGKGDLHDPRYSQVINMTVEASLFDEPSSTIYSACHHSLHIYPTREMEDDYRNNLPAIVAITIVSFCVLVGVGLYLWSHMTKKHQQNKLNAQSQQQHAQLNIDHARQAAAAERQLNEFIAHEVRNPLAAAMSACSFVSSAVQDLSELAASLPTAQPAAPPKPLFGIAPQQQQPPPLFAMSLPADNTPPQKTQQLQKQQDSIMEDLHIIDSSLNFINELLRNMLDVQRASHHQLKIDMAPTDVLRDILEPVDAMLYRRGRSDVKVIVECPHTDMMVMTDRLRLKQVVLNLSRNSIKFVEKGFIKLKVVVVGEDRHTQIWVEDTGPGIPEEKKDRLFAKFQESLDSLSQGTGIGLSLCKILMGLMGGDVALDRTYNSGVEGLPGARFIIDLKTPPIDQDEGDHFFDEDVQEAVANGGGDIEAPAPSLSIANGSQHSNNTGSTEQTSLMTVPEQAASMRPSTADLNLPQELKVLFVDDDTVLRKLFVRAVRRIAPEWKIQEAASGEAALRLVDEFNESNQDKSQDLFDLIFMDQYMASTQKQLLGTEVVQALRSRGVKSKVCGLSANDMANDFFAAGSDAFICKPLPAQKDILREVLYDLLFRTRDSCEHAPSVGSRGRSALVITPSNDAMSALSECESIPKVSKQLTAARATNKSPPPVAQPATSSSAEPVVVLVGSDKFVGC